MIRNYYQSPSFSGRAKIVKDADLICRNINSVFPHTTPSFSWLNFDMPTSYIGVFERYSKKLASLREATENTDTAFDYYDQTIKLLKQYKCANCNELADIAYIVCKNKNFDNVRQVGLYGFDRINSKFVDYDHVAVAFDHNGKSVILDPWLGLADFLQNCKTKYFCRFNKFLNNFNENFDLVFGQEFEVKIHKDDLKDLFIQHKELNDI